MAENDPAVTNKKKAKREGRSPAYPSIGLHNAIEKAKILYEREKRHAAPAVNVVKHWGYSPKSSAGLLTLSALKKFELIEDEGAGESRKVRLTDLALRIILDPDVKSKHEAIQKAALNPAIHAEIWEKYGGNLPSTETLKYYLHMERGFTGFGADEFIREFVDTISFAKLGESGTLSGEESDSGGIEMPMGSPAQRTEYISNPSQGQQAQGAVMQMVFRVKEGNIVLSMPSQLSAKSYKHFKTWLNLISNLVEEELLEESKGDKD
jgi:hypothetical protein